MPSTGTLRRRAHRGGPAEPRVPRAGRHHAANNSAMAAAIGWPDAPLYQVNPGDYISAAMEERKFLVCAAAPPSVLADRWVVPSCRGSRHHDRGRIVARAGARALSGATGASRGSGSAIGRRRRPVCTPRVPGLTGRRSSCGTRCTRPPPPTCRRCRSRSTAWSPPCAPSRTARCTPSPPPESGSRTCDGWRCTSSRM